MVTVKTMEKPNKKQVLLFYCVEAEELARKIAAQSDHIQLQSINWRSFDDGFPNLFINNAQYIRGQHVSFLASLSSPSVIFKQLSVIFALPSLFVASFTLVLPFFPTGSFERMEEEGDVPTAFTMARILSNIPISIGGPTSLVIYDIHALQESRYPICRHSYNHFPSICWLLHSMLLKLYPKDYQRRESQVTEDEKTNGTFSPQFENYLAVLNNTEQGKDCSVTKALETSPHDNNSILGIPTASSDKTTTNVAVNDLLCTICKELLYRPLVLNCGHGFLEQNVPEEYSARKTAIKNLKAREGGGSSTGSTQVPQGGQCSSVPMNDYLADPGVKVHFGVGCDFCGIVIAFPDDGAWKRFHKQLDLLR